MNSVVNFEEQYDVVVAGGGITGVAASIAAAESGARTALVEKTVLWGGLATNGLIFIYLPLCDGLGTQVSFGLCEKLFYASMKYGPGKIDPLWLEKVNRSESNHARLRTPFSPASFILAIDEMLESAGVDLWLDTLVVECIREVERVSGVIVENKSGRGALRGKTIIDATGDASVVRYGGGKFIEGANNLAMWALQVDERNDKPSSLRLSDTLTGAVNGAIEPIVEFNALPNKRRGISGKGVTDFVLDSRRWLRNNYKDCYADGKGSRESLYPVTLPSMAQFRKVARIAGKSSLKDGMHNVRISDSIGMAADWCNVGIVQEIPYSSMLPEKLTGVIAAGRCIDASGYSWELTRSIPAVAVSGEAAGVAAALSADAGITPDKLNIAELQKRLIKRGCVMHANDIGLVCCGDVGYVERELKTPFH